MAVRAKFRLNSYNTSMQNTYPHKKEDGSTDYQRAELAEVRTLNMTPVMDGSEENRRFYAASPSGSLQLGVMNQEAWKEFELNQDYYLTFEKASE